MQNWNYDREIWQSHGTVYLYTQSFLERPVVIVCTEYSSIFLVDVFLSSKRRLFISNRIDIMAREI